MPAPLDKTDYLPFRVFAFEQVTVAGTAIGFTAALEQPSNGTPAAVASVTVETAPVRYRADGVAPTATVGTLLNPGDVITVYGSGDLQAMQFIRTTGTSATLDVEYSR